MGAFIICEIVSTTKKIAIPIHSIRAIYDSEMDQGKDTIPCVQINYGKDEWALVEGKAEDITERIHKKLEETCFQY